MPGPVKGVIESVAVPAASGRTTIWNGSNSFLAADRLILSPFPVGGAASRSTLSIVVVVQSVAPAGDGSAKVISPVGVQSVHCAIPPLPPVPEPPDAPPFEHAAKATAPTPIHPDTCRILPMFAPPPTSMVSAAGVVRYSASGRSSDDESLGTSCAPRRGNAPRRV